MCGERYFVNLEDLMSNNVNFNLIPAWLLAIQELRVLAPNASLKFHSQTRLIVLVATHTGKTNRLLLQILLWVRHPEQNFLLCTSNHVVSRIVSHNTGRSL